MAERNDPPWGRPLEPDAIQRPGGADEPPTGEPPPWTQPDQGAATTGADAPAEAAAARYL